MADSGVYLDNAATTPPFPEAVAAVARAMESVYGNPSSRHRLGLDAANVVERAREVVARSVGAEGSEIVFTGGGSEANNLALKGAAWAYRRAGRRVVVTAVEHSSVLEPARWLEEMGFEVVVVPVGSDGRAGLDDVLAVVTPETLVVSVMHVNNEVGAIQPVAALGRRLGAVRPTSGRRKGLPLLHVDAVQSLGRLDVDVRALGADLLTVSAHKVHGPKGVGALFVRRGVRLVPLVHGGGHEGGRRSGTENVPGIAGFSAALERMMALGPSEVSRRAADLRRRLVDAVREGWPRVVVNGPAPVGSRTGRTGGGEDAVAPHREDAVAPHIVSLSFPGVPGEVMQQHLQARGVYVSTGSACGSHHRGRASHVLEAMGCPPDVAGSAVRVSFSPLNTADEVERAAGAMVEVARSLAQRRVGP